MASSSATNCTQDPNTPAVDNSAVECDELISTNCIVTGATNNYFKIKKGATFTEVISAIATMVQRYTTQSNTNASDIADLQPTYTVLESFISQTGTTAPAATAKLNTLAATPTFLRTGVGEYTITSTGAFPDTRTVMTPPEDVVTYTLGVETSRNVYTMTKVDTNTIRLNTAVVTPGGASVLTDGLLASATSFFKIKVYNT